MQPQQEKPSITYLYQQIQKIHSQYFEKVNFNEIQHIPQQFAKQTAIMNNTEQKIFDIIDNQCLVINYKAFAMYYPNLMKILRKDYKSSDQKNQKKEKNQNQIKQALQLIKKVTDVILSLNGQNEKAWNYKKALLKYEFYKKDMQYITRELKFNAAICLKFKKSTSYFEYRLFLIKAQLQFKLLSENNFKNTEDYQIILKQILQRQNHLITKVLARFFRNYYCWLYRIKFINTLLQSIKNKNLQQGQIIIMTILKIQLFNILKFLNLNMNDHSGYSYLINFLLQNHPKLKEQKLTQLQEWTYENLKFCQTAYQEKQSYQNLIMFHTYLSKNQKL